MQETNPKTMVSPVNAISGCVAQEIRIERVNPRVLDGIVSIDYSLFNTNNHRDTATYHALQQQHGECDWYSKRMSETRMEKWQSALGALVRKPEAVLTITATQQRKYFKPAAQLARQGVRAQSLHREEAQDLAKELMAQYDGRLLEPMSRNGWFVRTNACSPKDAQDDGGAGPHHSLVGVLLALFASDRVHVTMKGYTEHTKVYLVPFDRDVTIERELRVFVSDNRVTAMSQYDVFNASIFSTMDDAKLCNVAKCVDRFHRQQVAPRWDGISSYIMDLEYCHDGGASQEPCVRLIELNSFGAELASASALFHWVRDETELYTSDMICIRVRSLEKEEEEEEEEEKE